MCHHLTYSYGDVQVSDDHKMQHPATFTRDLLIEKVCTVSCWSVSGGLFLRFSITLLPTENSPDPHYSPPREVCGFY